jgi:hypothetical protein
MLPGWPLGGRFIKHKRPANAAHGPVSSQIGEFQPARTRNPPWPAAARHNIAVKINARPATPKLQIAVRR